MVELLCPSMFQIPGVHIHEKEMALIDLLPGFCALPLKNRNLVPILTTKTLKSHQCAYFAAVGFVKCSSLCYQAGAVDSLTMKFSFEQ
jgi:hypothetical protein